MLCLNEYESILAMDGVVLQRMNRYLVPEASSGCECMSQRVMKYVVVDG